MRCEGWRRYGGAFSFGSVKWQQCDNDAVVMLTVHQNNNIEKQPSCTKCWDEAMAYGIKILAAKPLAENAQTSTTDRM